MAKEKNLDLERKTFKDRAFNFKWFYDDDKKVIKLAASFKDFLTGNKLEEFSVLDFYVDPEAPTFKIVETAGNGFVLVKSSNELK
jgi:hypothetical protein